MTRNIWDFLSKQWKMKLVQMFTRTALTPCATPRGGEHTSGHNHVSPKLSVAIDKARTTLLLFFFSEGIQRHQTLLPALLFF